MISKACITGIYQRKLEEIARLGIDLTVIVPPGWRDGRRWLPLERARTQGYRLQVLPMALNGSFHLHFYPHLKSLIHETRSQLLHIDEEPYNLSTWQATRLAQKAGCPSIFFTWQNLLRRYPPPFNWIERDVYHCSAYGIAGNQEASQVLRQKGYAGPLRVIPQFGIDPDLYPPASAPTDSSFRIGYVGRLVPEKGVADLLQAAAGLTGNWQLALLGGGPERSRLQTLADALHISQRVSFEGPIPSLQVPAWMSRLHTLVLPSHTRPNWKEQFGRVLIEAMACGVPVIGSDSGEIPHVIGQAGLIFPEGKIYELIAHLHNLMHDGTLWSDLSQRGRERVSAHFTQAHIADQTVQVYREILSSPRGKL